MSIVWFVAFATFTVIALWYIATRMSHDRGKRNRALLIVGFVVVVFAAAVLSNYDSYNVLEEVSTNFDGPAASR